MNTQQRLGKLSIRLMLLLALLPFGIASAHTEDENLLFEHPVIKAEQVFDSKHFRIHYTLKGENAVEPNDRNANGIPDYVEDVSRYAEMVRSMQIARGWAAPPSDGNWGGNSLYDIYLLAETQGGGFADGGLDETIVGDNPNTTDVIEENASFSYIAIGTHYDETDLKTARDYLKVLLAHEYHHAIQFGYDGLEPLDWLWEAGASWMEEQLFDEVNDTYNVLESVFKSPDSCQLSYGGETRMEDDGRWYGLWVFLQFLSETYGHDIVRAIWEEARVKDGYDAIEAALAHYSTDLESTFKAYSVALLTRDFEEGKNFPTLRLEASIHSERFQAIDGVGQMAADYLELDLEGAKTVSLSTSHLNALFVGIKKGEASVFESDTNSVHLDANAFDKLYLIVMNLDQAKDELGCRSIDYSVNISNDKEQLDKATYSQTAKSFAPPYVEALAELPEDWSDWQEGEGYSDFEENYTSVTPPSHLIPSYLPEQLELVDAFEDNYDGIKSTFVFFMNTRDEEVFLDVYASEAPAAKLEELLNEWGYHETEKNIKQVANHEVQFERFEEEGESYLYAVFIKDGELIELSSNLSQTELRKVVQSLI